MGEKSGQFSLSSNDFIGAIVNAVIAAVLVVLAGIVSQPNFDVFSADWGAILKTVINAVILVVTTSLSRRFVTDGNGDIPTPLGKIKTG